MRLTPHEQERLLVSYAADVALRRRARGLRLNHPEAVAGLGGSSGVVTRGSSSPWPPARGYGSARPPRWSCSRIQPPTTRAAV